MNNAMKRRPYAAPNAELVCLAPEVSIATDNQSWKWGKDDNWGKNSWGVSFNTLKNASITGVTSWLDEDGLNSELSDD